MLRIIIGLSELPSLRDSIRNLEIKIEANSIRDKRLDAQVFKEIFV